MDGHGVLNGAENGRIDTMSLYMDSFSGQPQAYANG